MTDRRWPHWTGVWFKRDLERDLTLGGLAKFRDRQGLLLVSHDESSDAALGELAALLEPDLTVELAAEMTDSEWEEKTDILRTAGPHGTVFAPRLPKRICILAPRLDGFPPRMLSRVASLMDLAVRPFALLASTTRPESIGALLRSRLLECRKRGRPRRSKPTERSG